MENQLFDPLKPLSKTKDSIDPKWNKQQQSMEAKKDPFLFSNAFYEMIEVPLEHAINDYKVDGVSLKTLIHGISMIDINRDTQSVVSKVDGKLIQIKNGTDLARIVQIYIAYQNKSVDFKDFQSQNKQFDGKIGKFTKQWIVDLQWEMNNKLHMYEELFSSVVDQVEATIGWNPIGSLNKNSPLERFSDPKASYNNKGDIIVSVDTLSYNCALGRGELSYNWKNYTLPFPVHLSFGDKKNINILSAQNKQNLEKFIQYSWVIRSVLDRYLTTNSLLPDKDWLYFRSAGRGIEANVWDSTLWVSHNTLIISPSLLGRLSVDSFTNLSNTDLSKDTLALLNAIAREQYPQELPNGRKY